MTIIPAKGLVLATFILASGSVGLLWSQAAAYALGTGWCAVLAAGMADVLWLRRNIPRVQARIEVPASAVRGDTLDVTLAVQNGTQGRVRVAARPGLPLEGRPNTRVFTLRLSPGQETAIPFRVHLPIRGLHVFEDLHLRVLGRFQMFQGQTRIDSSHECRVYPDIRQVKDYIVSHRMRNAFAPHLRTARLRGIGSEFESLRDFEQGDDIRRIDWKATARMNRLITREYEIEHFQNILAVVDCGRLMAGDAHAATKLDHALDAALMIAGVAIENGDRFGLLLFARDVLAYLPPRGGMYHLQAVTETVYDKQPALVESHFRRAFMHLQGRLSKRSLILVISDVIDVEASAPLITGMLALSRRHLAVLAALRTPEVQEVIDEPVGDDTEGPFRKAVAYRLLRERGAVMARLQKGGVEVLDVKPEDLTIPLVNKYIELREMNRL